MWKRLYRLGCLGAIINTWVLLQFCLFGATNTTLLVVSTSCQRYSFDETLVGNVTVNGWKKSFKPYPQPIFSKRCFGVLLSHEIMRGFLVSRKALKKSFNKIKTSWLECRSATPAGTARAEGPAGACFSRRGDWSRARGKRPIGTEINVIGGNRTFSVASVSRCILFIYIKHLVIVIYPRKQDYKILYFNYRLPLQGSFFLLSDRVNNLFDWILWNPSRFLFN